MAGEEPADPPALHPDPLLMEGAPTRSWTPPPWYPHTTAPSLADALAALRAMLWHRRKPPAWSNGPHPDETLDPVLAALARAA